MKILSGCASLLAAIIIAFPAGAADEALDLEEAQFDQATAIPLMYSMEDLADAAPLDAPVPLPTSIPGASDHERRRPNLGAGVDATSPGVPALPRPSSTNLGLSGAFDITDTFALTSGYGIVDAKDRSQDRAQLGVRFAPSSQSSFTASIESSDPKQLNFTESDMVLNIGAQFTFGAPRAKKSGGRWR